MSISSQYFEVIADFAGIEGDANYIAVIKGDIVRLIKKDKELFTIEKNGHIGKESKISQIQMNLPKQTKQKVLQAKKSVKTLNDNKLKQPVVTQSSQNSKQSNKQISQTKSILTNDNHKSKIVSLHSNDQIKQQPVNQIQTQINPKQQTGSKFEKQEIDQEAPKYQFDQLHQIMKDIHSIIKSQTINDEEKEIKLKEIFNELKKKVQNELRRIFNINSFKLIRSYINDCRSGIEKIFLDIIEFVAERGVQMQNIFEQFFPNRFFDDFQQSELNTQIELIIKNKIEEEKEQKKYSDEAEQLIRIRIQIMKERDTDQQMKNIYIKVIDKNLNNLLIAIDKLKQDNNKGNKNEMNNEETESELKQSAQLIKAIPLIGEKDLNREYSATIIPDQIMKIVKERICPLIHLNCPPSINCTQCINIQHSPALLDFKTALFLSLAEISRFNKKFKSLLMIEHSFILHLTRPLVLFASKSQLNKEIKSQQQYNQQQLESTSSILDIISSLDFFQDLIRNYNISKDVISTPDALHSLILLTFCNINSRFNQEYDLQSLSVRSKSRLCLILIQDTGDASVQSELVSKGYAGANVIAISTAGGQGEEQDEEIDNGLSYISRFLKELYQGRLNPKIPDQPPFPPLPSFARSSKEQIEEEGGYEEVEAQLINKGQRYNINDSADFVKRRILYYYVDKSNPKPRWYNGRF